MDFFLSGSGKFKYVGELIPKRLTQYFIFNAERQYKLFAEGEFLGQVISGTNYSVRMHYWSFTKPCTMFAQAEKDLITMNYMYLNDIAATLVGVGKIVMRQGRYGLFYIPGNIQHKAKFKPGVYCCVQIDFDASILKPIAEHHPLLKPLVSLAEEKSKRGACEAQSVIYPYIKKMVDEILCCELQPAERMLFIESRIRTLLRLYLNGHAPQNENDTIADCRLETLGSLEKYMRQHLSEKIKVEEIARACNVSKSWLHRLCHDCFGMGVHELLLEKRMQAAAELLLTTSMQISAIATAVSPMTFSSFSSAFFHHFKQTPSAFRKNKVKNKKD